MVSRPVLFLKEAPAACAKNKKSRPHHRKIHAQGMHTYTYNEVWRSLVRLHRDELSRFTGGDLLTLANMSATKMR